MKLSSNMKKWLLAGVMVSALALSGCYMAPDQGALDNTNNLTVGNNTVPFSSIAPLPTNVPTPVPTPVPTANTGTIGNVNWDQNWGTAVVTTPPSNVVRPNVGQTVTLPPVNAATAKPVTLTPKPTAAPTSSTLKSGSSGSEVKEMQQRLKELKYYTGTVDGDFGAGTEAAVREFQQNNGLTVDGKAGKKTLEAMFSYYAVPKASTGTKVTVKPSTSTATKKPSATAVPSVSDNTYLQVNASGTKVRQMQERLISLGYLTGKADGKFGEATEAAVKAFQKRNNLWDDGIAGPDTLRLLFSNNAKRASSVAASIGETLQEGSEGNAVRSLQRKLIALGYLSGSADGSFGAATKAAVIQFQKNNGLTADGRAGTGTLDKLYSGNAISANGSGGNDSATSTGYTTLKEGSEGASVKKLQQKLKQLGYYNGSVDGSYGAGTEAAVSAFQRANKLTVDGKAGPTTQRLLYGGNATAADTSTTLESGDSGSRVRELQQALYELGYYQASIHGTYDKNTSNAVREFQINNGLSVDGRAGKKTLELLYSPYARASGNEAVSYNTVMMGDKGEDVVMVQQLLKRLGYSSREATGEFDQHTKDALIKFQKKNGISPADGIAGPATQSKLFSKNAIKN